MKILFLDIDGVLNYEGFAGRFDGAYGIDDELAADIRAIIEKTGAKIVSTTAAASRRTADVGAFIALTKCTK